MTDSILDIVASTANEKAVAEKNIDKIGLVHLATTTETTVGGQTYTSGQGRDINFWDSSKKKYVINRGVNFDKVYMAGVNSDRPTIISLCTDGNGKIDYADVGRIYTLIDSMDSDNKIVKHTRHGIIPAIDTDIYFLIGLSNKRAKAYVKDLAKRGILRQGKDDSYYMSPLLALQDKGITLDMYWLFRDILKEWLPAQAKKDIYWLTDYFNGKIDDDDTDPISKCVQQKEECLQAIDLVYKEHKNDPEYESAAAYADYDATMLDEFETEDLSQKTSREKNKKCCMAYDQIINILTHMYKSNPNLCFVDYDKLDIAFDPRQLTPELYVYLHYTITQAIRDELTADDLVQKAFGLIRSYFKFL